MPIGRSVGLCWSQQSDGEWLTAEMLYKHEARGNGWKLCGKMRKNSTQERGTEDSRGGRGVRGNVKDGQKGGRKHQLARAKITARGVKIGDRKIGKVVRGVLSTGGKKGRRAGEREARPSRGCAAVRNLALLKSDERRMP